jgi:hypothetical protein
MISIRTRGTVVASAFLLCAGCLNLKIEPEERMPIAATINGQPVRLIVDTGSPGLVLFRPAAERLGLTVTEPPYGAHLGPGSVPAGLTDECSLAIGRSSLRTRLTVIDVPAHSVPDCEGLAGWPLFKNGIFILDAIGLRMEYVDKTPEGTAGWLKLPIRTSSGVLALDPPPGTKESGVVVMDTGSPFGISLSADKWRAWRATHPHAPTTLNASSTPGSGWEVGEECWAEKLSLGAIALSDVPVQKANVTDEHVAGSGEFAAVLGLAALRRLEIVVDGKHGFVYLRPRQSPAPPYAGNRLGAVFLPRGGQSDDIVAHVVAGTPAYEAGIREGDLLLKVYDLDITKWRTDPRAGILSLFWRQPAGTELDLTLRHLGMQYRAHVEFRDIIGPGIANGD